MLRKNLPRLTDEQYVWLCNNAKGYRDVVELAFEMGQVNALAETDKDFKLAAKIVGTAMAKIAVSNVN